MRICAGRSKILALALAAVLGTRAFNKVEEEVEGCIETIGDRCEESDGLHGVLVALSMARRATDEHFDYCYCCVQSLRLVCSLFDLNNNRLADEIKGAIECLAYLYQRLLLPEHF